MNSGSLEEYKRLLEEDIKLLGYLDFRYSIFAGENNNRQEYQLRIECNQDKFEVYSTVDRAGVLGKYEFEDYHAAMFKFLELMQLGVLVNRRAVRDNEKPEYPSPLWDGIQK